MFNLKEININIEVPESQLDFGLSKGFAPHGSSQSHYKTLKSSVSDPVEFGKGFLYGALFSKTLRLDQVVFHKTEGGMLVGADPKPVYCFEYKDLDGKEYYEFETCFSKK